ncbi:MAG: dihydroorotate dehydrogenase electron transfer subunit [Dehalococcoidia bacterium]|jgi:dihydroorotate dehydrogenase electron transfer subunit
MKVAKGRIVTTERLFGSTYFTWFHAPSLVPGASPGRFLMLRLDAGSDPLLPRPMSYHRVRPGGEVGILYEARGRVTAMLSQKPAGSELLLWGPLGRGFNVRPTAKNLLLVAGGMGVAPLVWLADKAVAKGNNVTFVVGARTAALLPPSNLLPPQADVVVVTEDGSAGQAGLATRLFEERLPQADQAFACGPQAMYESMAEVMRRTGSRKPVQVLLETPMACGTGLCYGCAVETRRGMRQVCRDGPRFGLLDVF